MLVNFRILKSLASIKKETKAKQKENMMGLRQLGILLINEVVKEIIQTLKDSDQEAVALRIQIINLKDLLLKYKGLQRRKSISPTNFQKVQEISFKIPHEMPKLVAEMDQYINRELWKKTQLLKQMNRVTMKNLLIKVLLWRDRQY